MTDAATPPPDTDEDLFENAPCGYVSTRPDGTIVRLNRTFEQLTGLRREDLTERRRFQDLLSPGGRIYFETHVDPLLRMQGAVREIAVEIACADGSRLPALINAVLRSDKAHRATMIRITVFDASDRRRYEQELLEARRREQELGKRLQRSMLAGEIPSSERLRIETVYRPGVGALEIGGDWYDAFWLDELDEVALIVGDVVGRGLDAAATMGQLRSAVRALAATGLGPAALITALDEYSRRHQVGVMATLIYAQLRLDTGRLRFSCAGHPPPALLPPAEAPLLLWSGRSPPLAARLSSEPHRVEAEYVLAQGSTLLLYTDGLVERRSTPIADGFGALIRQLAGRRGADLAELVDGLVDTLDDPDGRDDVCLLGAGYGARAA